MSDHNYALWRWNPLVGSSINEKWLKENLATVELKLPPQWQTEITQENFLDTPDILKQMEALVAGNEEDDNWMDMVTIEIP